MPFSAYVGKPGSGKSHGVVEFVVLPALESGRTVVTNLALHFDKVREGFPAATVVKLDLDSILRNPPLIFEVAPPGCVLVIDEAWKVLPAGQSPKDVPAAFKQILAEHRHRVDEQGNSMQVVICTQDLSQIGKFARVLIDETFRMTKLTSLGSSSRYRVDVYSGCAEGENPPPKKRVREMLSKYKPEVWQWYQSHTMRQGDGSGANEAKIDSRGVVWKSPWLWAGAAAILIGMPWGIYSAVSFFTADRSAKPAKNGGADPREGFPAARVVPQPGRVARVGGWRITGEVIVSGGGASQVFLQDGDRYVILDPRDWCQRDVSGFLICTFEGQRVSNQVQYLPARVSAPVVPLLAAPGDES